ncbi:MAG TPA: MBL fold metallo-hydrolase [Polyangia bacterium]|jgi:glyoxylase-like metal-dependent hydrolase (beta-lactamase superfamily II)
MVALNEITAHVAALPIINATFSNIYVVREDGGYTLIDPGPVGTAPMILALDRQGVLPLARVIVTHAHPAHAGSLARVVRGTGVPAFVHPEDAPFLDGREPPLLPRGHRRPLIAAIGKVVDLCPPLFKMEPLVTGHAVGSLVPLATPGHTPGHVCLWHKEDRVLFSGDALLFDGTHLRLSDDELSEDPPRARASLAALGEVEFDHLLPGHGPPLLTTAGARVRAFLRDEGIL